MQRRTIMTRAEAAALLGIPADADPAVVRHAWRMWARIAHPDVGGDAAHFHRLQDARRLLMVPVPTPIEPAPRPAWRQVLVRPRHPVWLILSGLAAICLAASPAITASPTTTVPPVIASLPAALAGAAWAICACRSVLGPAADPGHRMLALAACWVPIAVGQQLVAIVVGTSLVTLLPVLALPLVAAVSAVNPGAGLWRPVGRAS